MNLLKVLQELVDSADDQGCSDDLTVVSRQPIESLKEMLEDLQKKDCDVHSLFTSVQGNPFDGMSLGGIFTTAEEVVTYNEEQKRYMPESGIARIYPL